MVEIRLPDGSTQKHEGPVTARQVAENIGAGLARAAVGARVNGELTDLDRPIETDADLAIVTRPRKGTGLEKQDPDALYLLRHSTAHVMAEAIQRLWPEAQLAYGPPLDDGFYYDIRLEEPISSDDFEKIEAEMARIVKENRPFTRYELDVEKGLRRLEEEGNKYKIDNARRAIEGGADRLSWYATGEPQKDWEDLCMGPHVPATGDIGAFKVTSVAASHWHGDVTQDRFQRVYGTSFFDKKDLKAHLKRLEEARQRDHRVLGRQLGLFHIDETVGQGLILWTPRGAAIRQVLQEFILQHLTAQGYHQVFTPHIGKLELYKTSGHFPYYQQSQYTPLIDREQLSELATEGCGCGELSNRMRSGDIEGYLLKPMNCPHHIKIFDSQPHSYRDLPVRLAEFGTVYRWEQSGELGGMTRV
ncbi:MAG: threonine--tRNA ligase, partial [Phycisphaeraceae bacterium]|nr:threonine--tRNA ligase [Phycisphaeraceae bacterium]